MNQKTEKTTTPNPVLRAKENWQRYEYVRDRGHRRHIDESRDLEGIYLGAGEQWPEEDRAIVESEGRLAEEVNLVQPAVDAALGYQINNRVDISFRPRGRGADEDKATTLSKVAMQIADNNKFKWVESQVFADGLIERRGFFDIRVTFDDNMMGEVAIVDMDQRDVIPDPDAKSYDPDGWADVTVTRWYTLDEIEWNFGAQARRAVENSGDPPEDTDFGDDSSDEGRNKFGDRNTGLQFDAYIGNEHVAVPRWRIIDRQYWKLVPREVAVYPTGDVRPVHDIPPEKRAELQAQGAIIVRRLHKVVHWLVTTATVVLFDGESPYEHFTIVPYFPRFRRGKSRGMVDAAASPQRLLNKAVSSFVHALSTTANSGWIVEEDSITNMDEDELEERGSQTGLVLVVRKGTKQRPEKIQPNQIPTGIDRIIAIAAANIKATTGMSDVLRGEGGEQQSGLALQTRQFAAQQELALPLDNLARTRHMLASRMLKLIQKFYDDPRILRIVETDPMGKEQSVELPINMPQPDGSILNDLTMGEYDVVITEVPLQVTFENSQFQQALEMRKEGVMIPDPFIVRHSNLAEKQEIIEAMQSQQQPTDPTLEAKAKLMAAQADKMQAETTAKKVETMFSATEAAQNIAAIPQVAPLADEILGSAGFQDMNAAPLVPQVSAPVPEPSSGMRENTSPLFPPRPASPMRGIEGGQDGQEISI